MQDVITVNYTLTCLLSVLSEGQAGAAYELSNIAALFWKSKALRGKLISSRPFACNVLRQNDKQELAGSLQIVKSKAVLCTAEELEGVGVGLHPFLTSALCGGVWSATHPGRFIPMGRTP